MISIEENGVLCPVCRLYRFSAVDDHEACHACGWKNDQYQMEHTDRADGINGVSLNEYRDKFVEWMHI